MNFINKTIFNGTNLQWEQKKDSTKGCQQKTQKKPKHMWQRGTRGDGISLKSRSQLNPWQLMISNKIKAKILVAYQAKYLISTHNEAIEQQLNLTNKDYPN